MALTFDDAGLVFDVNQGTILEASAGSGKTTILTERWIASFLYLLVWEKKSVSEALGSMTALTFTRKAANEMKIRIRSRLEEIWNGELEHMILQLQEYVGDIPYPMQDILMLLQNQKTLIDDLLSGAVITTINAYVLQSLRANPLELDSAVGVSPEDTGYDFSISEKEAQQETIRALIQNKYQGESLQKFFEFGVFLCGLSRWTKLFEQIRILVANYGDDAVRQGLDKSSFFLFCDKVYGAVEGGVDILWNEILEFSVRALLDQLNLEKNGNKGKLTGDNGDLEKVLRSLSSDNLVPLFQKEFLGQYKISIVKNEDLLSLRENSMEAYQYLIDSIYRVIIPLIYPISELCTQNLHKIREQKGEISFSDSEIVFYESLKKESFVKKVCFPIKYFFADEYQDTSDLQKNIFDIIISGDNVIPFFVGDPKQSIYSFRKANVHVFNKTATEFRNRGYSVKALNTNYRSDAKHVELVNYLFDDIFSKDTCGIEYKNQMVKSSNLEGQFYYTLSLGTEEGEKRTIQEKLDLAYKDAIYLLTQLLDSGVNPGEIMVLFRNVKSILEFYRLAREWAPDLPVSSSARQILWNSAYIIPLVSFLKVLIRPHHNFSMVELLKTPFFRKTDDEIVFLLEKAGKGSVFEILTLEEQEFLEHFMILRDRIPLQELLELIIEKTAYEEILCSFPESGEALATLRLFLYEAQKIQQQYNVSVNEFIRLLEKESFSTEGAEFSGEEGKTLCLMTIHASKGLESPYVIYVHKDSEKKYSGNTFPLYINGKIGFDLFGKGKISEILLDEYFQEQLSEEKRLAYVALTRAKKYFAFCGLPSMVKISSKGDEKIRENSWAAFLNKELVESSLLSVGNLISDYSLEKPSMIQVSESVSESNQERYDYLIKKEQEFKYTEIPQFLSVSLLLDAEFNPQTFLEKYRMHSFRVMESLREIGEDEISLRTSGSMEIGALVHTLLQNFDDPEEKQLYDYLDTYHPEKTDIYEKSLYYAYRYWGSDFARSLRKTSSYTDKERQVLGILPYGIMIRATADLYVSSEDDVRTIVDYKLSVGNRLDRYQRQLSYYALLSERAGFKVDRLILFDLKDGREIECLWDMQETEKQFNNMVDQVIELLVKKQ